MTSSPAASRSNPRSRDRRTLRTRKQLREALMELTLDKGYDLVTVEDITERADLGRTTFYLHYRDKDELLMESIETTANELVQQVEKMQTRGANTGFPSTPFELAFQHAAENSTLYRILLKSDVASKALTRLRAFISSSARLYLPALANYGKMPGDLPREMSKNLPDIPPRLLQQVSDYFASSLLGVLTWWLEEGMPYQPREMASFFLTIFVGGAREIFATAKPSS